MPKPARLIDPPATRLGAIPAPLRFFGDTHDPAALEAWWEVMCAEATPERIGQIAEWMAERIAEDPRQALEEMRSFLPAPGTPWTLARVVCMYCEAVIRYEDWRGARALEGVLACTTTGICDDCCEEAA
jgi:hypothetical protein